MKPVAITRMTVTSALGAGNETHLQALRDGRSGLAPCRFEDVSLTCHVGEVAGVDAIALPAELEAYDCRNHRLAWLGLQQNGFRAAVRAARERHGAQRVAVLLGSSTSGILQTEHAYRRRGPDGALPDDFHYAETHNTGSLARFVALALQLDGPQWVVSTACSSSAKVFAAAARLMELGWIDAAVVGGVDSLCLTTLYGFNSLELLSPQICRPWDAGRNGLSLGEAAAFALLERKVRGMAEPQAWLLGTGESSDGFHMSSPLPDGGGAVAAMQQALAGAGLQPGDIDYINLHGTATHNNDAAEDRAVQTVFGPAVPCSSTKGATGHTLGAAGGVEAVLGVLALQHGLIPGGLNRLHPDAELQSNYVDHSRAAPLRHVLSNSFGFGGSNASLVFGAAR
jgi:3-oxoacyl-[acyl-carrier-protein] synthase I